MSGSLIKRDDMINWMTAEGNAALTEQPRADWRQLNTVLMDQGSCESMTGKMDFHLFELLHAGQHYMEGESAYEQGDIHHGSAVSGCLNYNQSNTDIKQSAEGTASIQQIYIDDSIFTGVAAGLAKGDPDNLKPLGFIGVFEPRLRQVAMAILDEARNPTEGSDLYADLLAQQIATLILRRRLGNAAGAEGAVHPLTATEIARITDHIEADLTEAGGLDTLAALVDRDVYSFARAFKAVTGEAPHQFLIQRRLDRARALLCHSQDSLADIAYATGFASQSHMTATFSKHVGMPPGAYRKAVRR
ncbi:MAG: AraC family transcriptional regulator [Pseudomonadota bacterium]